VDSPDLADWAPAMVGDGGTPRPSVLTGGGGNVDVDVIGDGRYVCAGNANEFCRTPVPMVNADDLGIAPIVEDTGLELLTV